jgi:valyl-tRNA synthetase
MRNFTNKLWNMARFIELSKAQAKKAGSKNDKDAQLLKKTEDLAIEVTRLLDNNDFNHAAQNLYEFIWHEFADVYIEDVKNRVDEHSFNALSLSFNTLLKLLHPFMPFVTQEINERLFKGEEDLIVSNWPVK